MEQYSRLIFLICLQNTFRVEGAHYEEEASLRTKLLTDYNNTIRPYRKVTIKATLSLLNINILDAPSQRLSVSGWLSFTWQDPRLSWNTTQHDGIKDIFDTELVFWRPEIIVDNSVDNLGILESDKLLIRATYDGNMTWEPPGIFETHCDVDVTFYPFDTQICVVEVTTWAQTVDEIDIYAKDETIDLADFEESGEWNVLGTWTERHLLKDGSDIHSEIAFSIKLQRKPMYYVTTILIPVIVTSILCIVVFLLPAGSGEKVGYALTILLTYTVMLTLVASYMPPTSKHTSVLGVYLTIILFIGVFTTVITVIVLHLHHRSDSKEIPEWLQFLVRNCMVPVARWHRQKFHEMDDICEETPTRFSQSMYHSSKVHPETRNSKHMTKGSYSYNGRARDILATVGNQQNLIEYISTHRNQPEFKAENRKHYMKYENGQRNRFEMNNENQTQNEGLDSRNSTDKTHRLRWDEISVILDAFCLRVLGVFVLALTLIVILTMVIGGRW